MRITRNWLDHAEGSVLVEFGKTRVLCAASFTEGVPRWLKGRGTGWVDAQRDGHLAMSLAVSPAAWPVAPVRVQLRALGGGGGAVEWREIRAVRGGS